MPLSRKTREFASSTISKDSVFDWGNRSFGTNGGGESLSGNEFDCKDSTGASTLTSAEGRTSSGMSTQSHQSRSSRLMHELQDDLSALASHLTDANNLHKPFKKPHPPSSTSTERKKGTRYDPSTMYRIRDIADLVDDTSDSESDDEVITKLGALSGDIEGGSQSTTRRSNGEQETSTHHYWPTFMNSAHFHRQTLAIMSLVALIFAASLAIGFAIINSDQTKTHHTNNNTPQLATGNDNEAASRQQRLERAERVVIACSEQHLNADMSECQKLCHAKLCCFDSGEYSCKSDKKKDCAVHAGCEALVEGIPLDAAEEDEN